jgi:hypothetical protein
VSHRYTQSWCVLLVTQGTRLSRQSQIQNISQNKIENVQVLSLYVQQEQVTIIGEKAGEGEGAKQMLLS